MQILLFVSFIIIIIMISTKISVNLIEHFVMANLTKIKKCQAVLKLWYIERSWRFCGVFEIISNPTKCLHIFQRGTWAGRPGSGLVQSP